jgi:hypothetical protein
MARYRVPGYGYPVIVWFDNQTGRRIDAVSFVSPESVEQWRQEVRGFFAGGKPPHVDDLNVLAADVKKLLKE